jgi:hypothetical protein
MLPRRFALRTRPSVPITGMPNVRAASPHFLLKAPGHPDAFTRVAQYVQSAARGKHNER